MAVALISTGVHFPDNTIQTTAATGVPARSWYSLSLGNYTTYTNSFGLEITVAACCNFNGAYGWTDQCLVNGTVIVQASYDAAYARMTYLFEVPAGATYQVQFPTGVQFAYVLR
jgi:hypothetical protein